MKKAVYKTLSLILAAVLALSLCAMTLSAAKPSETGIKLHTDLTSDAVVTAQLDVISGRSYTTVNVTFRRDNNGNYYNWLSNNLSSGEDVKFALANSSVANSDVFSSKGKVLSWTKLNQVLRIYINGTQAAVYKCDEGNKNGNIWNIFVEVKASSASSRTSSAVSSQTSSAVSSQTSSAVSSRTSSAVSSRTTTYNVQYFKYQGAGYGSDSWTGITKYTLGSSFTVSGNIFTREGFEFVSWERISGSGTATYLPGQDLTADDNYTFFGVWKKVVASSETSSVASSQTSSVASSQTSSVASSQTSSVASSQTSSVASSQTSSVASSQTSSVASSQTSSVASSQTSSVASFQTSSVSSAETVIPTPNYVIVLNSVPTASAESSADAEQVEIIPDGTPLTDLPAGGAIGSSAPFFAILSAIGLAGLAVCAGKKK